MKKIYLVLVRAVEFVFVFVVFQVLLLWTFPPKTQKSEMHTMVASRYHKVRFSNQVLENIICDDANKREFQSHINLDAVIDSLKIQKNDTIYIDSHSYTSNDERLHFVICLYHTANSELGYQTVGINCSRPEYSKFSGTNINDFVTESKTFSNETPDFVCKWNCQNKFPEYNLDRIVVVNDTIRVYSVLYTD